MFHNVEHMDTLTLGEFEQIVLMSILRLEPEAYGATIRRDIEARTARRLSISAVYTTLDRLEQKGLVRSWIGDPTAERGGRRRKHFALEPVGARALKAAHRDYMAMATGLDWSMKARRLKAL
jgi:DNA-binding PadR family transcriptional regulator